MINGVDDIETAGNGAETLSDADFLRELAVRVEAMLDIMSGKLDAVQRQADHIDAQVHEIGQFIDEHRPALARGLALMSAGAKLGAWRRPKD